MVREKKKRKRGDKNRALVVGREYVIKHKGHTFMANHLYTSFFRCLFFKLQNKYGPYHKEFT